MKYNYINFVVFTAVILSFTTCNGNDDMEFEVEARLTIDGTLKTFTEVTANRVSGGGFLISLTNGASENDQNYEAVFFKIADLSESTFNFPADNQEYSDLGDVRFMLYRNNQISDRYAFITAQYYRVATIVSTLTINNYNSDTGLIEGVFSGHLFASLNDNDPTDGISASNEVLITNGSFTARLD